MVEWYRAFAGIDAIIDDTEQLVAAVVRAIAGIRSRGRRRARSTSRRRGGA